MWLKVGTCNRHCYAHSPEETFLQDFQEISQKSSLPWITLSIMLNSCNFTTVSAVQFITHFSWKWFRVHMLDSQYLRFSGNFKMSVLEFRYYCEYMCFGWIFFMFALELSIWNAHMERLLLLLKKLCVTLSLSKMLYS